MTLAGLPAPPVLCQARWEVPHAASLLPLHRADCVFLKNGRQVPGKSKYFSSCSLYALTNVPWLKLVTWPNSDSSWEATTQELNTRVGSVLFDEGHQSSNIPFSSSLL